MKKVMGFSGLPGSGKSTMIEAIEQLGTVVTMGDVIRNEAKKRGIEPSGDNLGAIAKDLRKKGGPEIVAHRCVELIQQIPEEVVFIDGLRSMVEVKTFRKYWKFPIIAADVKKEIRFDRLLQRKRSDDPRAIKDLEERDKREINFGIDEVIKNADYVLDNSGSIDEIKKKTKEIVEQILLDY